MVFKVKKLMGSWNSMEISTWRGTAPFSLANFRKTYIILFFVFSPIVPRNRFAHEDVLNEHISLRRGLRALLCSVKCRHTIIYTLWCLKLRGLWGRGAHADIFYVKCPPSPRSARFYKMSYEYKILKWLLLLVQTGFTWTERETRWAWWIWKHSKLCSVW